MPLHVHEYPSSSGEQFIALFGGLDMRIGIFGGSFDPVHQGHLLMAELCREHCQLDELRLVPAAIPPHKQDQGRAGDSHRQEMLRLAIGGNDRLVPWDVELQRGGVSYTVDTLNVLRNEHATAEIFLLIGADSLYDLPNWRSPEQICDLATLAVANRPGNPTVQFHGLQEVTTPERLQRFQDQVVPMPLMEISSSEIRRRIASGQSIRYQTPRAVEEYIKTHGLYANESV